MKRALLWAGGSILAVCVLGVLAIYVFLRASLPLLDGEWRVAAAGPAAVGSAIEVSIERDAAGAPTVRGASVVDVAFGLGFVHAQDRYFQMDLSRRLAAGELAALLGESMLGQDRRARVFRLREVAREVVAAATPEQREWLSAYTRGVNEGLAALTARPWEYGLLRQAPLPWREEDSILVVQAMWWQLQYEKVNSDMTRRQVIARVESLLADAAQRDRVLEFFFPRSNEWDTPNFQSLAEAALIDARGGHRAPPLPPPELLDLRRLQAALPQQERVARRDSAQASAARDALGNSGRAPRLDWLTLEDEARPGSNAWAVAGAHAAGGAALIAGDMHLGLRVPAVWYRARLQVAEPNGEVLELNGVTLPGLPAVAAGSNGHIAWSFTNSYGDWVDVRGYACEPDGATYFSGGTPQRLTRHLERIEIAGKAPEMFEVLESADGVMIAKESATEGTATTCWLARWLVTEPGATNLASLELQRVKDLPTALALASQVGIPHQNFVLGDRSGRIAWTIIGRIPEGELGPETPRPIVWRDATTAPAIVDPEVGRIWSANSRHVEGPLERVLGNDEANGGMGYDTGVRARQIRDGLLNLTQPATPADMLAIQLDDRATLLDRWQRLLLATLDEQAVRNQPKRAELRVLVADWQGHAAVDSVSYRLVRSFRDHTRRSVWNMFTETLQAAEGSSAFPLFEGSVWRLVTEQPEHLLVGYENWRALLLAQADRVIAESEDSCGALTRCTWGQRNVSRIRHPLSPALGVLGRWLDMPERALAGDLNVPRVATSGFGASERFALSPGREAEGYLHIPGGQSGHPLSPFYREGFDDWVSGVPRPLLPGETRHRLRLVAER